MDLQKKKTSTKKIKLSKTDIPQQNPLGPLMQEINQLKSELASLKAKKSTKTGKQAEENELKSNKDINVSEQGLVKLDRSLQMAISRQKYSEAIKQIIFPIREHELKINLELNKLNQIIKQFNEDKIISCLNKIIEYINISVRQLEIENRTIQPNPVNQDFIYNCKQQTKLYQQLNKQLEKQNIQFKHLLAKQVDQIDRLESMCGDYKEQFQMLSHRYLGLEQQNQRVRLVCEGLREQRQQIEEKLKIYERSIEKKQSEILMYEEDINYNRIEVEKNKTQKRQIQRLHESLQKDYRELKCKFETEIQSLLKQKNKWKSQCQNRRACEKENLNQEEQKNQLKKQLQIMRRQLKILSDQMIETKQRLSQSQKKNIMYEHENYRLKTQNEKLLRNTQFYKSEMSEISKQVEQLREQSQKYRDLAIRSKVGIRNSNKTSALQQIQELIKKHKTQQDQDIE